MGSAQEEGGEGREGRGTGGDWPLPVPTACRRQRAPERASEEDNLWSENNEAVQGVSS
jgi:hypothetical protein